MNTYKVKVFSNLFENPCDSDLLFVDAETPEDAGLKTLKSQLGFDDELEKAQGFVEVDDVRYELEWVPHLKQVSPSPKIIPLSEDRLKMVPGVKIKTIFRYLALRAEPSFQECLINYCSDEPWEITEILDSEINHFREDNPLHWFSNIEKIRWVKIRDKIGNEGWALAHSLEIV